MSNNIEAPRKFQTYKQCQGYDINGARPVMIPNDSGGWVNRFDAEHLAEQLKRAQLRITELEALCVKPRIAPHQYRQCVNELTENAREYAGAGQLRERISYVLGEYIEPDHPHTRASPCVKLSNAADELEIVVNWIGGLPVPTAAATLNYGRVLDAIKAIRAAGGTIEGSM